MMLLDDVDGCSILLASQQRLDVFLSRMMWEDSRTDDSLPVYLCYWRGINTPSQHYSVWIGWHVDECWPH
jgi:hypothetical protein